MYGSQAQYRKLWCCRTEVTQAPGWSSKMTARFTVFLFCPYFEYFVFEKYKALVLLVFSCKVISSSFCNLWSVARQAPVHGVLQARILEWVAIPFSRGSSRPKDQTLVSCASCIDRRILYHWEAPSGCSAAAAAAKSTNLCLP